VVSGWKDAQKSPWIVARRDQATKLRRPEALAVGDGARQQQLPRALARCCAAPTARQDPLARRTMAAQNPTVSCRRSGEEAVGVVP